MSSRSQSPAPGIDPVAPSAAASGPSGPGQSWSSQPSVDQPGYGQPAAGRAGAGQSGGTRASHRREYGVAGPGEPGQPAGAPPSPAGPRGPQWYRQPRWIAVLAAVVLVVAGVGTWVGLSGGSGAHSGAASHKPVPSALMKALDPDEQEQRGHGPAAVLGLQAEHPDPGDLHRAGGWHHRGRLPDLPEPEGPVRRVHGQGLVAELRPVQAELQRLRLQCHVRRGRLEPPVPAPQDVHRRPDDSGPGEGRPGRGPGVLQLHPGPGVHGVDPERRQHAGLRVRTGARRRVELVGARTPQHRPEDRCAAWLGVE